MREYPVPPRPVRFSSCIRSVLTTKSSRPVLLAVAMFSALAVIFGIAAGSRAVLWVPAIVCLVGAGAATLALWWLLRRARDMLLGIRDGRLTQATVEKVVARPHRRFSGATYEVADGVPRGGLFTNVIIRADDESTVRGVYVVTEPWAEELRPGSVLDVLRDPRRGGILFAVGPTEH